MSIPSELLYTKSHEWVRLDGDVATVGVTWYAQDALGDVVFVELPELGRELDAEEDFGVVESVKAVSDVYSPLAGEVIEVNEDLSDEPERINASPYGEGWLIRIKLADPSEASKLLDASAYESHLHH